MWVSENSYQMAILDIFNKFKFAQEQLPSPVINGEIVSTIGTTSFYILDGIIYNQDNIALDTYDKIARHYQVKACLNIIRYSLQQIDWHIASDDEEVRKVLTYALEKIWNQLMTISYKSLKYGFSPSVKVFDTEEIDGKTYIIYKKLKDLRVKDCLVVVDDFGNFDGFWYRRGSMFEKQISTQYAFWYVHNKENNNHYGNPMIRDVYKSWYYSEKIHSFANRYYERFGEPLVVGRAPGGNARVKDSSGAVTTSQNLMARIIDGIRNHSSVQLPSEKDDQGKDYLYDIKYLESQMRGFDFENYMQRLDMEMVRGLLVPAMMFQDAERGSYALGSAQIEAFYTNLMGMMDNIKEFVEAYLFPQLLAYNFPDKKTVKLNYEPLSTTSRTFINLMITTMIQTGKVMPDLDQLEERTGFSFKEVVEPVPSVTPATVKEDIAKNNAIMQEKMTLQFEKKLGREMLAKEKEEIKKLTDILEKQINE